MTWIKLCGMTSARDVAAAEEAGADAVGFVTAVDSVRAVSAEGAAEFGRGSLLERFLVTDDATPEGLLAAAERAEVTGVQPHGRHSEPAAIAAIAAGYSVLFPIPVEPGIDVFAFPEGSVPILDTGTPGGGVRFDRTLLMGLPERFVAAGGLTPDNVGEVLADLRPYGVDVSSGIEREPGVKDPALMRRFVEAAR